MTRVRLGVGSVLVAVLLTGCFPNDPAPTPTPTEAVATPTAIPTPEPTKPEMSQLVLSADGLGPLLLGQAPPVTSPDLDILVFDDDFCVGEEGPDGEVPPGLWVTNYPEVSDGFYGNPGRAFSVQVLDGLVERIDVKSAQIVTPEGIRIGSSAAEVVAAYPDALSPTWDGGVTDLYVVEGSAGRLLIEVSTDDRIADYWNSDQVDRVLQISAWSRDIDPRGVAGSDNTVGNCSAP